MFGSSQPEVPEVDASLVMDAINKKEDCVILDVRTPEEVSDGKIAGSINIPVDQVSAEVEKALPDKDKTIYVHCKGGVRSARAVDEMVKLGYKNAFSMAGGMLAWEEKQYPINI
jgi:rhodanese-related sulfurtransferase